MAMHRRKRRRARTGIYPPLAVAMLLLTVALALWAWRGLGGAEWGAARIEVNQPVGGTRRPPSGSVADLRVAVYDVGAETVSMLPLEEYLVGVVSAEMPASFAPQALRAQAVAARTRTVASMRGLGGAGCVKQAGADICGDSAHCQAWAGDGTLRERWGADYQSNRRKVAQAVQATRGEVITYAGQPIQVLYHAVSGGATEDVEHVFAQALPYLRGVDSPGEEGASRYRSEQRFAYAQAAETLNQTFSKAGLTAENLPISLAVAGRFDSGRVAAVRVGAEVITGRQLRQTLGLFSTNFTLEFAQGELVVRQRGHGHGVGMSQVGADAMARAGNGYVDILKHYFTGVQVERW